MAAEPTQDTQARMQRLAAERPRLMSRRLDATLSLGERFSLRFHLSMCVACRQCDRQFALLKRAGQGHLAANEDR